VEKVIYTYCQGVFIGACVELAARGTLYGQKPGHESAVYASRAARTIEAVAARATIPDGPALVIRGQGGGDGGLFAGILARYLALAATELPALGDEFAAAGRLAADLVFGSAEAAWRNRVNAPGGPLFGPDWTKPAILPERTIRSRRAGRPERDLSVQTSAWMLLEAAAVVERAGIFPSDGSSRA
jgi:predicted alpha-1,6-mannanase (GH76 family)